MPLLRAAFFFLLLLPAVGSTTAQDSDALDAFLRRHVDRFGLPGAALTVVRGDRIVFSRAYGEGPGPDRPYYTGSLSKVLTATAVLQLADGGALQLDDPVARWLPEILFNGASAEGLAVEHLLRHRSGLIRRQGFIPAPTLAELQETPFRLTLYYPPGTREAYSNLNYALLGLIAERAAGRPFAEVMEQQLFRPLAMTHSTAGKSPDAGQLAEGHQYWFGWPLPAREGPYRATAIPAGFVISSAEDLGRFLIAQLNGGAFRGRQVISPASVDRMTRPADGEAAGRGTGWSLGQYEGQPLWQHSGATATAYAYMAVLPESDCAFVFMTNINAFNPIVNSIEGIPKGVLNYLHGKAPGSYFPSNRLVLAGFGLLLLLSLIDLGQKTWRWFRAGLPLTSGRSQRAMLLLVFWKLVVPVAVIWGALQYFDTPFNALLSLQPDIGWTIVVSVFAGFVAGFLDYFVRVQQQKA